MLAALARIPERMANTAATAEASNDSGIADNFARVGQAAGDASPISQAI